MKSYKAHRELGMIHSEKNRKRNDSVIILTATILTFLSILRHWHANMAKELRETKKTMNEQ